MVKKILFSISILLLVTGIYIGGCRFVEYRETMAKVKEELKQKEAYLQEHVGIAYGNKYFGDMLLEGMTGEQIRVALQSAYISMQDKTLQITVDNRVYTYKPSDFEENIFFSASDGTTYTDPAELAEYIVNMEKNLPTEEEYDIAIHKKPASYLKVTLESSYSEKKIKEAVKTLYKLHYTRAENASMDTSGKVVKSKAGRVLECEKVEQDIRDYLDSIHTEDFKELYLTQKQDPEWTTEDIEKVNTVIGEFTTTFATGGNRGHNLVLGAERVNGIFLLPEESASIGDALHDGSDGKQFLAAGSYVNGRTVDTLGGGICQIASTLYNAVLRAGIIPTERYNHSMAVAYVPLGLDATIAEGSLDLVIKNTLKYPIFIKGYTKGSKIGFQIYSYKGAKEGYTYEPRSEKLSSLSANAYLDVYKGKKKVKSIFLHKDTYAPHS